MKIDCPKCGTKITIDKLLLHLRYGDEPFDILALQERLAEAEGLFRRVWTMLEECDSLTPPKYNFEADELHGLIQDFLGKTT